jgi:hypothetical protein
MAKKKPTPSVNNPYAGHQTIGIVLPLVIKEVCKMLQVPPERIISHFLWDIGRTVNISHGVVQNEATTYFISCGYGWELFTPDQIGQMILELSTMKGTTHRYGEKQWVKHEQWMKMSDAYIRVWRAKWKAKMKQQ